MLIIQICDVICIYTYLNNKCINEIVVNKIEIINGLLI